MAVKKAKSSGNPVRDELFRLMKEGKLPQVRALTRKERKELTESGYDLYQPKVDENTIIPALEMKCTDWIIDRAQQCSKYLCGLYTWADLWE